MSLQSNIRNRALVFAILIAFAIMISNVQAIGVTPGRNTIDFEPGLEKDISFTILNNDHKDFNAMIYVEGDLKDSITPGDTIVSFTKTDNSKPYSYRVKLPDRIDEPGDHWAKIVVVELPPGKDIEDLEGQFIVATTAVIHQLRVKVPYPGKYVEPSLVVQGEDPDKPVTFFVKAYNLGTEDIGEAYATIDILGPTNEVVASLETEKAPIPSKNYKELIVQWEGDIKPGTYAAKVVLHYDGQVSTVEETFSVGNVYIDVREVTVKNFRLGGVAKFNILVENKWNQEIKDVYANLIIQDDQENVIGDVNSPSADVPGFSTQTLEAYWDTEGIESGEYDASLKLHYADRVTERKLKAYVELESITTEIIGVTARALTTGTREGGGPDIITPLVIILIMINAGWFFYFRRRK